jgi:hypothetical protein
LVAEFERLNREGYASLLANMIQQKCPTGAARIGKNSDRPMDCRMSAAGSSRDDRQEVAQKIVSDNSARKSSTAKKASIRLPKVNRRLNQVRYAGECYDVSPGAAELFQQLVDRCGDWFAASSILSKPSAIKASLPEPLKRLIETAKGKGYRLKIG